MSISSWLRMWQCQTYSQPKLVTSLTIGSVGLPFPYTHVRILTSEGAIGFRECAVDEVGEICISNPGVYEGSTYTEADKNKELFAEGRFLRTGDLGRIDADGYLFITGRFL